MMPGNLRSAADVHVPGGMGEAHACFVWLVSTDRSDHEFIQGVGKRVCVYIYIYIYIRI